MEEHDGTVSNDLTVPKGIGWGVSVPKLAIPSARGPWHPSSRSRAAAAKNRKARELPGVEESTKECCNRPANNTGVEPGSEYERLWAAYNANPGDGTRNDLVEAYHGFAETVTRHFANRLPRWVDRGDLSTAGSVGLMNAVVAYNPDRGVRFESYCELRIKGALLDELRTQDWMPRPFRQRIEQQKRTIEALRAREVREPTDEEIALEMGLDLDLYQQLFGVGLPGTPACSMGAHGADDDAMLMLEVVPDPSVLDPEEGLTREELVSLVTQRLTDQEYRILYLRYWEGLAMREISAAIELSESRVRKIHTRLIERLQERMQVNQAE